MLFANLFLVLGACQRPAPTTPNDEEVLTVRALNSGGRTRTYRVHEPAEPATASTRVASRRTGPHSDTVARARNINSASVARRTDTAAQTVVSAAWPVVLALHGGGGDGLAMDRLTSLREVADNAGFLLVYPDGVGGNWNDGRPEVGATADDVRFIRDLLDELATLYTIDPQRIYATGMSNGGHMCFRLAYELSDRIAAIAPVAALLSAPLSRTLPPRAVPALVIAGDADPICPYDGGRVGGTLTDRGVVISAAETERLWTRTWGVLPPPVRDDLADLAPDDGTRAERHSFALPADPATAVFVLVTVRGGGHTWPGGFQYLATGIVGPTSRDFSASRLIWEFFRRHALP